MADVAGTPRKITLDGVTYDVFADTNIQSTPGRYQNDPVPTSGRTMRKMTRRTPSRESVILVANAVEQEALREISDSNADIPMSYETAGGDVWRANGFINFESHETEENRATVHMHPREGWDLFAAA